MEKLYTQEGKRLAQLRQSMGLSQASMGERFGLTQSRYAHYEMGIAKVDERFLKALRFEFNLNPVWFREGKGTMVFSPEESKPEDETLNDVMGVFCKLRPNYRNLLLNYARDLREVQTAERN